MTVPNRLPWTIIVDDAVDRRELARIADQVRHGAWHKNAKTTSRAETRSTAHVPSVVLTFSAFGLDEDVGLDLAGYAVKLIDMAVASSVTDADLAAWSADATAAAAYAARVNDPIEDSIVKGRFAGLTVATPFTRHFAFRRPHTPIGARPGDPVCTMDESLVTRLIPTVPPILLLRRILTTGETTTLGFEALHVVVNNFDLLNPIEAMRLHARFDSVKDRAA